MIGGGKPLLTPTDLFNFLPKEILHHQQHDSTTPIELMKLTRLDTNGDLRISLEELSVVTDGLGDDSSLQVHLALTAKSPAGMSVIWVTDTIEENASVFYGTVSGNFTQNRKAKTYTYDVGWGWGKYLNYAEMDGLLPSTRYFYRVSSSGTEHDFLTSTPNKGPVRIAFEGDQGTVIPLGYAVANQMKKDSLSHGIDLVHVLGDLSYAWGAIPGPEIERIWDYYCEIMSPLASSIPMMVTIGNHETDNGAIAFRDRFSMPSRSPTDDKFRNFYYSYDYGLVHVVSFATDAISNFSYADQMAWLREDLTRARNNRKNVPWILTTTHRPMYSSDTFEHDQHVPGAPEQQEYEKLFLEFNVDLMLSGHCHIYERIYPNINGTVTNSGNVYKNPKGLAHVVQGTGGAFYTDSFSGNRPAWSAKRCDHYSCRYGYGYAVFHNASHFQYQYMLEYDGTVYDEFWIVKD